MTIEFVTEHLNAIAQICDDLPDLQSKVVRVHVSAQLKIHHAALKGYFLGQEKDISE